MIAMNELLASDVSIERIAQPHHDILYDARRGEIVRIAPASGPARPAKPVLLHANLQLTRRCNLACTYCRTSSSPKVDTTAELTTEGWIAIFEQLKHDGVRSVFVTGGEIFSRPDIWGLLRELEQRFIVHILSNGYALSDVLTEEQVSIVRHFASAQISLDSADAETHDRRRGRGSWARALRALEVVHGLGVEAVISAVVTGGANTSVQVLSELAGRLGVALLLRPLLSQGRAAALKCSAANPMTLCEQLGLVPYARGFLAYSEELYRFGIHTSHVQSCGVFAVASDGRVKPLLDS